MTDYHTEAMSEPATPPGMEPVGELQGVGNMTAEQPVPEPLPVADPPAGNSTTDHAMPLLESSHPVSSGHVLTPAAAPVPSGSSHPPAKLLAQPQSSKRPASQPLNLIPKRRSSSRSIKRKKFDDELVESSLAKTSRMKGAPPTPMAPGGAVGVEPGRPLMPSVEQLAPEKKKVSKSSSSKRVKKSKQLVQVAKDLGRWKPSDDLLLINGVLQTNDLAAVHMGVKFSCRFTQREVQERWYALLYDPVVSKLACQSMRELHPDAIVAVQSRALFSKDEERILTKVASTSQPTLETFQDVFGKNPNVWHPCRTAKALQMHWQLLKQFHLLEDQTVQQLPKGDQVLNFSDAEDTIDDSELRDVRDETLEHELAVADRRQKREIRQLEQELPKWQAMVDSVTGLSPPEFDNQTLAVLRGRLVRYLMRSREITLGRATKDNQIDVDLSLEGPSWKISRKQGTIKLKSNGDFFIANEGRRPIFIDGRPVLSGAKWKLNNNSVVEISGLRFVFLINQDLIALIRAETAKMAQQ
uniref:Microspherule protein 1 n=1 Tax=Petromyzon marinus TaxID=7757 RepID=A0AAJ7WYD7_PETMA|nr:microspherule protein 1 isoform X3 [Petromyzon marinus]